MADDISSESLAKKAFLITFIGFVIWAGASFVFVVNGDLGEEQPKTDDLVETFQP